MQIIISEQTHDISHGISEAEAARRLATYGPNAIETAKAESPFVIFLRQFKSLIVIILAVAAGVSFAFSDWLEGFAIIGVILVNAITGFVLEWRAAQSMEALKKLDVTLAKVIREGKTREIPSEEVTLGDVVWLEAGDIVPADGVVAAASQLQADESALTGESLPVEKQPGEPDANAPLAEQPHRLFKGTAVVNGNGKIVVTGIGSQTELGKISQMVESAGKSATPLEKKLDTMTRKLIWVTAFLAILFFVFGWWQGKDLLLMLKTSIALAVAAIPEGLSIVATISLAYGMLRLARKNVIVKRLSAVETLGSTNVIFSDKTGTLTLNQIEVNTICLSEGTWEVRVGEKQTILSGPANGLDTPTYQKLLQLAVLCNNAHIGNGTPTGDPLEISLLQWAQMQGVSRQRLEPEFPRLAEQAFSSDTRIMGTLHQPTPQNFLIAAKGASEEILNRCDRILMENEAAPFDRSQKEEWVKLSNQLAAKGLRTIAFAYRNSAIQPQTGWVNDLTWVGMIGFLDPPRLEVVPSLQSCREAGIRVIMVTGDHPATAQHIGEKIGLTTADIAPMTGMLMPDVAHLTDQQRQRLLDTRIFARVSPAQKLDLISLYQSHGDIVGMTGDGINDAPALKKADIGIAMGLRGTQVARETAEMVLKDDSFTSIVAAIAQGRAIFGNIRKFIMYLVSCNLSEIFVVTAAGLLGLGLPLTPLQILFLNVVTDVFPALALGIGKGNAFVMHQPPRNPKSSILETTHWQAVTVYALVMTGSVLLAAFYGDKFLHISQATDNNIVFYGLALAQLLHVFNMTSGRAPLLNNEITRNRYVWLALAVCLLILALTYYVPILREALNIETLHSQDWMLVIVAAFVPLMFIQLLKRLHLLW